MGIGSSIGFFMSFQNVVMIMLMHWMLTRFIDFKSTEKAFVYFIMLMIIFENIGVRLSAQRVLIAHFYLLLQVQRFYSLIV